METVSQKYDSKSSVMLFPLPFIKLYIRNARLCPNLLVVSLGPKGVAGFGNYCSGLRCSRKRLNRELLFKCLETCLEMD